MDHMALLANRGHAVIASIHQPRPAIFERFNKVVLLSEGYQVYLGAPAQITDWFQKCLGYPYVASRDGNVPDWIMDTVSVGFAKPRATAVRWADLSPDLRATVFDEQSGVRFACTSNGKAFSRSPSVYKKKSVLITMRS